MPGGPSIRRVDVRSSQLVQAMPATGPLVDRFGRVHTDLRVSVTDRCNFRCTYCIPEEGIEFLPRSEVLSYEEIIRFVGIARSMGVGTVRITGGEPLMRRNLPILIEGLSALGLEDLSLTTNASRLSVMAEELAAAGLRRINVSCDSLDPDRFRRIRRRGELGPVLEGIAAAESAGLSPIKLNVVLMRGVNDDEVIRFASFARETGRQVRFIEFMPLDGDDGWKRDSVVPGNEVVAQINEVWPLEAVPDPEDPSAPADTYRFTDGAGTIGVISSVTAPFCGSCNRLRLTADGAIRNCLFARSEMSVRDLMRSGGSDEDVAQMIRRSVWGKEAGHGINDPTFLRPRRSMSMIGG